MKNIERITKLILTADSIELRRGWSLAQKDNPLLCSYCKSPLFYVEIVWGVVDVTEEYKDFKVFGKEREPQYALREIGLQLYCAECGHFHEPYASYFYLLEKVVCSWNDEELDIAEAEEIKHCLDQMNQKGDFTPNYRSIQMDYLKKKLVSYEEMLATYAESKKRRRKKQRKI